MGGPLGGRALFLLFSFFADPDAGVCERNKPPYTRGPCPPKRGRYFPERFGPPGGASAPPDPPSMGLRPPLAGFDPSCMGQKQPKVAGNP